MPRYYTPEVPSWSTEPIAMVLPSTLNELLLRQLWRTPSLLLLLREVDEPRGRCGVVRWGKMVDCSEKLQAAVEFEFGKTTHAYVLGFPQTTAVNISSCLLLLYLLVSLLSLPFQDSSSSVLSLGISHHFSPLLSLSVWLLLFFFLCFFVVLCVFFCLILMSVWL